MKETHVMRKLLLATVSLVAFSASAWATTSVVNQPGNANIAGVNQSAATSDGSSASDIQQLTNNNQAYVTQAEEAGSAGGSQSQIYQQDLGFGAGGNNLAVVNQISRTDGNANPNQSNIYQDTTNWAYVTQDGSENFSHVGQAVSNQAYVSQTGEQNVSGVYQGGHNNIAYSYAVGDNNSILVSQQGNNNVAVGSATGDGNDITIYQAGTNNYALSSATSDGNASFIDQSGDANNAQVYQTTGNDSSTVTQPGDGNTAIVVQ
jgi:Curlin associated repeat